MKYLFSIFLGLVILLGLSASASALCYIREYKTAMAVFGSTSVPIAPGDTNSSDQTIDPSGGVVSSTAFKSTTQSIRLVCGANVSFVFGPAPQTATTSNALLPAFTVEYFAVVPGQVISAILNANP